MLNVPCNRELKRYLVSTAALEPDLCWNICSLSEIFELLRLCIDAMSKDCSLSDLSSFSMFSVDKHSQPQITDAYLLATENETSIFVMK